MASGQGLTSFTDFVAATGPSVLTSAKDVVNEAVKKNYLLSKLLKGRELSEVVKGGSKIRDLIMFDDNGSFQHYKPNATFTPTNPSVLDTHEIDWRFASFHMAWTDHEVLLNGTPSSIYHQYKDIKRAKEQAAWTSGLNGIENSITSEAPSNSEMEQADGSKPHSLFSLITEDTTNYHPSGYTTVQGIDPANQSKWRNQVSTYDHTDIFDTTSGLFAAFDDMWEDVRFEAPEYKRQYFEVDRLNRMSILTSKQGVTLYKQALRASNDRLLGGVSAQDPDYNKPTYSGIPVSKVDNLTSAAVYTSAVEASGEPRYYWVNANYMKMIFHSKRYFEKTPPLRHPQQPYSWVCYFDVWYNLFLRSRQRQGIIAPTSPSN